MATFSQYLRLRLHVAASPRQVIRQSRTLLNPFAKKERSARSARHQFYRDMLKHHERSQHLLPR